MTNENNYPKSQMNIKCKNCKQNCELVYDHHHDQTYSTTCGIVIIQSNNIEINYPADPLYWEKQKEKREEIKKLKQIIAKLKEYEIPYATNEENEIIIPSMTPQEQLIIKNLSEELEYKIIKELKYTPTGEYIGSHYIIKKDTTKKEAEEEKWWFNW